MKFEVLSVSDVDGGLLGGDDVWTYRWVPTFRKNIMPPSSGRHNPEYYHEEGFGCLYCR
jgi:hypothetical protein